MIIKNSIVVEDSKLLLDICGINDKNLRRIESITEGQVFTTGNEIYVEGENAGLMEKLINNLAKILKNGGKVYPNMIDVLFEELRINEDFDSEEILSASIEITKVKKIFNPRTVNQGLLIKLLREKDIVFTYGPAGTGKTFISIAYAINELLNKKTKKVILTRPVVEAGESLGFLPGDYIQKINPYLVPLFDAINQIVNSELYIKLTTQNLIEIAPLAYMRGRTFENALVILDEAQNTTPNQMKMFLTRLGNNAKLIITGDITQIDLPLRKKSGMVEALKILNNINDIGFLEFDEKDVVRHPIVKKIINAYRKHEKN